MIRENILDIDLSLDLDMMIIIIILNKNLFVVDILKKEIVLFYLTIPIT